MKGSFDTPSTRGREGAHQGRDGETSKKVGEPRHQTSDTRRGHNDCSGPLKEEHQ